jgi:hypothetical protein
MKKFLKQVAKCFQKVAYVTPCIVCTLFFIASGCGNQNEASESFEATADYYWFGKEKFLFQKIDEKFYVEFYSTDENKIRKECKKKGIKLYDVYEIGDLASIHVIKGTERPGAKIFTNLMGGRMEGDYKRCASVLSSTLYWSPFYLFRDGFEIQVLSVFTVELKPETTLKQLEELAEKNAVEILGMINKYDADLKEYLPDLAYRLACTNHSKGNALEMAHLFYESGLFEFTIPNILHPLSTIN